MAFRTQRVPAALLDGNEWHPRGRENSAGGNLGNYNLLFQRQGNSWHGVREIHVPEGRCRKAFTLAINDHWRAALYHVTTRLKEEAAREY